MRKINDLVSGEPCNRACSTLAWSVPVSAPITDDASDFGGEC
jgi:hypothetical protein